MEISHWQASGTTKLAVKANAWCSGRTRRKDEEEVVVLAHGEILQRGELRAEVGVREHRALAAPGRPGGVDDRGDVALLRDVAVEERVGRGRGRRGGLEEAVVVVEAHAALAAVLGDGAVRQDDRAHVLERPHHLADERAGLAAAEEGDGLGVAQDVRDLVRMEADVHRDGRDAARDDAEVGRHPLGAVLHHERDAVPGLHAETAERLRDGAGAAVEVVERPFVPDVAGLPAHERGGGGLGVGVEEKGAERGHGRGPAGIAARPGRPGRGACFKILPYSFEFRKAFFAGAGSAGRNENPRKHGRVFVLPGLPTWWE